MKSAILVLLATLVATAAFAQGPAAGYRVAW